MLSSAIVLGPQRREPIVCDAVDDLVPSRDEPVAVALQNAGRSAVGIDQADQPVWLSWAEDAVVLLSGDS